MAWKKKPFSITHPHLLSEWDYRKNQLLGLGDPEKLTAGSGKKVWWICGKNHSWESYIFNRTRKNNSGCPYCSGNKVGYGNDLLTNHPELCIQWDFDKNKLGPENYLPGSNKKVWWKCSKEHSWCAVVAARVNGTGCPYCSNKKVGYGNDLLTNFPKLCKEWDFEKNLLCPEKILPGTGKKAWWKCKKGHSWKTFIHNRTKPENPRGCPYCSNKKVGYGNDLLTNHLDLCTEWDFDKNKLGPENYTPGSKKRVWWACEKGHSWKECLSKRTVRGHGCPYCSSHRVGYGNDLLTNHPELCEDWDYEKNQLGPENYTPGSNKNVWWKCEKDHSWLSLINNRVSKVSGCPQCCKTNVSKISQRWLDSLGIEQREVQIGPYRVDGFDPETNTVYEFLGDYWHGNPKIFSAGKINPTSKKSFSKLFDQTFRRFDKLKKLGYKVIYIWESDFNK